MLLMSILVRFGCLFLPPPLTRGTAALSNQLRLASTRLQMLKQKLGSAAAPAPIASAADKPAPIATASQQSEVIPHVEAGCSRITRCLVARWPVQ